MTGFQKRPRNVVSRHFLDEFRMPLLQQLHFSRTLYRQFNQTPSRSFISFTSVLTALP